MEDIITTYTYEDTPFIPEKYHSYPPALVTGEDGLINPALVIDNGSYQIRAGFENDDFPRLMFKSAIAKNRGNKKDRDWEVQIGNDIKDFEAVRWMVRTPFDLNVVVNFSVQESLLDHTFSHLNINTEECVPHPVVITEPMANPKYSQNKMLELLFEAYAVPKISFSVDSLFGLYSFTQAQSSITALIISCGFQATHIIPVIEGVVDKSNARRINLGGYNNSAYLSRLLQLKYPKRATLFTLSRTEEYLQKRTVIPPCYYDEIIKWENLDYSSKSRTYIKESQSNDVNQHNTTDSFLELAKKNRHLEIEIYQLEYMLEMEKENPDIFGQLLVDAGYSTVDEVKTKLTDVKEAWENLHLTLDKFKHSFDDPSIQFEDFQAMEILFQPSLVGYDQAGISETIEQVLGLYPDDVQSNLAKNIFLTGGNASVTGFKERIVNDVRKMRPFQSVFNVNVTNSMAIDAWSGAKLWANSIRNNIDAWITREYFNENGTDFDYKLTCALFD